MYTKNFLIIVSLLLITCNSCNSQKNKETKIIITTEYGEIKLKLYNETPGHRDNFIKLIKNGYFTDKIFHRVIKNFMIQGGMDASNSNQVQNSNTIPAEINPKFYHKRGALAAARKGDQVNPNRESTANQFYIVQGEKFSMDQLKQIETNINNQLIQSKARKYYEEEQKKHQANNTTFDQQSLVASVIEKAKQENALTPYKLSQQQIETYTTIGGTPHLDGTYTVFGEVTEGLEVVDKIAEVKALPGDKPERDVKFSIRIID